MTAPPIHILALIASSIVGGGFVLLAVLATVPSLRHKSFELMRTLLSAALILLCLIAVFMMGPQMRLAALTLAGARIGYEIATLRLPGEKTLRLPGEKHVLLVAIGTAALTLVSVLYTPVALACAGLWFVLLGRVAILQGTKMPALPDMLLFPILPFALLAHGAVAADLAPLMLASYVLVEIFDSFALLFGSLWGRTKAFPSLSPNKTIEGLAGGTLCLLIAAIGAALIWHIALLPALVTVLLIGALAIAGDLTASRHKRIAKVKDYPRMLPRQGGLLDSLDSWIAAGAGLTTLHLMVSMW
ncbi:phosphatidate cytidylyltransferase [Shimia sp.]|uniref:phosphatidate cytidylyltransferase n=1 Tax=Shimia sp. TaxID=1954381 RepID=UPI003B8E652F